MITIRFPTGFSIQYNDANYVVTKDAGVTDLYTQKDGSWIARVPSAGCVIEVKRPCRLYQAVDSVELADSFLELLKNDSTRGRISSHTAAKIKSILAAKLDGRRGVWR